MYISDWSLDGLANGTYPFDLVFGAVGFSGDAASASAFHISEAEAMERGELESLERRSR